MHDTHVYKALKYAVNHSNFTFEDMLKVVGSPETTRYILGVNHANPNSRYFKEWGRTKGEYSGTYVATLEAISLYQQWVQSKQAEKTLFVAVSAVIVTAFFAAMSIFVTLSNLKTDVWTAGLATIILVIVGACTAFWPAVKANIRNSWQQFLKEFK